MSDSIIRWWPKSQCTMSIASMDEAHAAIAARLETHENIAANLRNDFRECALRAEKAEARLAEAERHRDQNRRTALEYQARLAEAERLFAEVELRAWSLIGAIERQQPSAQIGATGINHHKTVLRRFLERAPDSADECPGCEAGCGADDPAHICNASTVSASRAAEVQK